MATFTKAPQQSIKCYNCSQLPELKLHTHSTVTSQIAVYLEQLLEKTYLFGSTNGILLPSILELAQFFKCCEMDVFDALYLLEKQAYHYELHGIDSPVKLLGNQSLKPVNTNKKRSWDFFPHPLFKHKASA